MPKSKRLKLEKATKELECEFSQCTDVCSGIYDLSAHVREHVRLMVEQLNQFNAASESQSAVSETTSEVTSGTGNERYDYVYIAYLMATCQHRDTKIREIFQKQTLILNKSTPIGYPVDPTLLVLNNSFCTSFDPDSLCFTSLY